MSEVEKTRLYQGIRLFQNIPLSLEAMCKAHTIIIAGPELSIVLGNRMPINFLLEKPILMCYLDPSLYAHNLGVQILRQSKWEMGYYALPTKMMTRLCIGGKSCITQLTH